MPIAPLAATPESLVVCSMTAISSPGEGHRARWASQTWSCATELACGARQQRLRRTLSSSPFVSESVTGLHYRPNARKLTKNRLVQERIMSREQAVARDMGAAQGQDIEMRCKGGE